MKWTNITLIVLGVEMIISPWLLGFSELNLPTWNNLIIGVLVIVFSLWTHYIYKSKI
jgi:hypothetical protein